MSLSATIRSIRDRGLADMHVNRCGGYRREPVPQLGQKFIGNPGTGINVSNPGTDLLTVTSVMSSHPDYVVDVTSFSWLRASRVSRDVHSGTAGRCRGGHHHQRRSDESSVAVDVRVRSPADPDIASNRRFSIRDVFLGGTQR